MWKLPCTIWTKSALPKDVYKRQPHHQETIRKLDETVYDDSVLDYPGDSPEDPEPLLIHRESFNLTKLYKDEAIMELELSDKPFVLYRNARRDVLQIVYRRPAGDYSIIELGRDVYKRQGCRHSSPYWIKESPAA